MSCKDTLNEACASQGIDVPHRAGATPSRADEFSNARIGFAIAGGHPEKRCVYSDCVRRTARHLGGLLQRHVGVRTDPSAEAGRNA